MYVATVPPTKNYSDIVDEMSRSRNCSGNLTEEQVTLVIARGIIAALCWALLLAVLVILLVLAKWYYQRVCGSVIKRLTLGLTASTMVFQLFLALNYPYHKRFCEADGFLVQYFGSLWLLFTLGISIVLFFKALEITHSWKSALLLACVGKDKESSFACCGWTINKVELATFASIIALPLFIDWVPFATRSYGLDLAEAPLCWIYRLQADCSTHTAGFWEQIWLWNVPFGLVDILTLLLLVTSLCLVKRGLKIAKVQKLIEVGYLDSVISLAILSFAFTLATTINYYYSFQEIHHSVSWVAYVLYVPYPFIVTLIPVSLLFAIHFPLSSLIARACRKCQRKKSSLEKDIEIEKDLKTIPKSDWRPVNQPSHTTWNPLHSEASVL